MKTTQNLFEDIQINVKLKIAMLWISFMLLYGYVDYFALYMPGNINGIIKGKVYLFEITQSFIMAALVALTIPTLMVFISVALPSKPNRIINIIVAIIHIPYMLFNLSGEAWAHMYFAAVV
ncbi:MAG: DUF6326 family protein, partial [Sediminibacterium sp.]|nr:DUF6326 family protein [Sediminibacterium sp.]